MSLKEINEMPTCVDIIPVGCKGVHESTLRSFNILRKVKDYLNRGIEHKLILELIEEMEG